MFEPDNGPCFILATHTFQTTREDQPHHCMDTVYREFSACLSGIAASPVDLLALPDFGGASPSHIAELMSKGYTTCSSLICNSTSDYGDPLDRRYAFGESF
eukprot:scpid108864/ scgid8725/ 